MLGSERLSHPLREKCPVSSDCGQIIAWHTTTTSNKLLTYDAFERNEKEAKGQHLGQDRGQHTAYK